MTHQKRQTRARIALQYSRRRCHRRREYSRAQGSRKEFI